jgi:protein phosphatase 2C
MILYWEDQGDREYMEDRLVFDTCICKNFEYYAIFDGHGGAEVASFLKIHMKNCIQETLKEHINRYGELTDNQITGILMISFEKVVNLLPSIISNNTGSTALVILKTQKKIWIANCGDSRAIMNVGRKQALQLSFDHKPTRPDEYERIIKKEGSVAKAYHGDVYRVNGILAISRSIGDLALYPHITWKPEIHSYTIDNDKNNYIFIASDGIWDVFENDEIINLINTSIINSNINNIGHELILLARNKGSFDNISCMIIPC